MGEVVNWLAADITESAVKSAEKDVIEIKEDGSRDYLQACEAAINSAKEAVLLAVTNHPGVNEESIDHLQRTAAIQVGNSHSEGVNMRSSGDAS